MRRSRLTPVSSGPSSGAAAVVVIARLGEAISSWPAPSRPAPASAPSLAGRSGGQARSLRRPAARPLAARRWLPARTRAGRRQQIRVANFRKSWQLFGKQTARQQFQRAPRTDLAGKLPVRLEAAGQVETLHQVDQEQHAAQFGEDAVQPLRPARLLRRSRVAAACRSTECGRSGWPAAASALPTVRKVGSSMRAFRRRISAEWPAAGSEPDCAALAL